MTTFYMELPDGFDFEGYINEYAGQVKIVRALYIAEKFKNLSVEAYNIAIDQIKNTTSDVKRYLHTCYLLNSILHQQQKPTFKIDQEWVTNTNKMNADTLERYQYDLTIANRNRIREERRISYSRLGDYCYLKGDFVRAQENYTSSSMFQSKSEHTVETKINANKILVAQGKHPQRTYIHHNITKNISNKDVFLAKISCYNVLSMLKKPESAQYDAIAKTLMSIQFEYRESISDIIAPGDITLYCSMCAMATFNRQQLQDLIENSNFKRYLLLDPKICEFLLAFYHAKYSTFFNLVREYSNLLLLDVYFEPHISKIMQLQKQKAMEQYIKAFSTVDIQKISNTFQMSLNDMENTLFDIISRKKLNFRINDQTKTLHERRYDKRHTAFNKAKQIENEFERLFKINRSKMLLDKLQLLEQL